MPSLINFSSSSAVTVIFHLSLITFAFVLASIDFSVNKTLKVILRSYILITFLAFLAIFFNIGLLIEMLGFVINYKDGIYRINAFATEPSYAAFLISLIWFFLAKENLISTKETFLVIASLILLKSLYGLLLALLIFLQIMDLRRLHLKFHKYIFFLSIAALYLIFFDTFLINKLNNVLVFTGPSSELDIQSGAAAVRLLPYVYMFSSDLGSTFSIFGSGAGVFQNQFYNDYAYLFTEGVVLSGHMAGVIYDYGILTFLAIFIIFVKKFPAKKYVSYPFVILLFLNTGIGTYLFVASLSLILRTKHDD